MDLERFQEFMLQSAAKHDSEIAAIRDTMRQSASRHDSEMTGVRESFNLIRESLTSVSNTVGHLVDNQVYLQESLDLFTRKMIDESQIRESEMRELRTELKELSHIVFRHATDPDAHRVT